MICEQKYPGDDDYIAHFHYVLQAFKDHRYITVDGKPPVLDIRTLTTLKI